MRAALSMPAIGRKGLSSECFEGLSVHQLLSLLNDTPFIGALVNALSVELFPGVG